MQGDWIWRKGDAKADEYVQFYTDFAYNGGKCDLKLCVDGMFCVYVNGKIAGFGKYPDYPKYRVEEEIDLSGFVKIGTNRLSIVAWYIGESFFTYSPGEAGLIFELSGDNGILSQSDSAVQCRLAPDYSSYLKRKITLQLGFSYRYDSTKEDEWMIPGKKESGFTSAQVKDLPKNFHKRPVMRLCTKEPLPERIIQQGTFREGKFETAGERLLRASLAFVPPAEMFGTKKMYYTLDEPLQMCSEEDGMYLIVDLGHEEAGYLHLDFTVDETCELEIGYGQHIADGRVRTYIDERNFTFEYRAKKGRNVFTDYFRRLGGRYLQIFFHTKKVLLRRATVIPVYYPVRRRKKKIEDGLHRLIYDISVRTLELCMHDHYEDTPWREQSFYTMDSRNQILFGYTAFEGTEYARAGLRMFAEARRPDGLLTLCCPQGEASDYPIPYFSLMYILAVAEYSEHTGDLSLAEEVFEVMCGILENFESRIGTGGLIQNYADPKIWDFYEWTDGMDGPTHESSLDAPLNGFYLIAAKKFGRICELLSKEDGGTGKTAEKVRKACGQFFVAEKGLYKTFIGKPEHYSELTNSLFVVAGVPNEKQTDFILDKLAQNENGMVKISASHSIFKYDAMLVRGEKYRNVIIHEVEERYTRMLRAGATSFWETDHGSEDFDRAGSLCHGWSSVPIYVFERFGLCPDDQA